MRHFFVLLLLIPSFAIGAPKPATDDRATTGPVAPAPMESFEMRNMEGWTVYINQADLAAHPAEMERALAHLRHQLYMSRLVLPPEAAARTRERIPFWIEFDTAVATSYHPRADWLLEHGYPSPEGLETVISIGRGRSFPFAAYHQPWMVLHELTHAYDFTILGEGRHYGNSRLSGVYQQAKSSGQFDAVLARYSDKTRHYGMNNMMEYFAESSEAFFGTNDFYPFVRAQLREADPTMEKLLIDLWGVDDDALRMTERELAAFLDHPGHGNATTTGAASGLSGPFKATRVYGRRAINGWQVLVDPVLGRRRGYGNEILRLLEAKLHLVERYMPTHTVEKMRSIPIWLEENDAAVPYIAAHTTTESLTRAGLNPEKFGSVEIGQTDRFFQWQALQPFAILNVLARVTYHRLSSEEKQLVSEAWQETVKGGHLDNVLRFDGRQTRHPALRDAESFFAEMTVAYYGRNDHYPFVQFETKRLLPDVCRLLARIYGGAAR